MPGIRRGQAKCGQGIRHDIGGSCQILPGGSGKVHDAFDAGEHAPNAVPFSKPEGEQKYQIKISAAAVVDMIRKMANWSAEDNWNIPGIYFAEDDALVYDVSAAYRPSPKGGWTVKRQKEEAAAAALAGNPVADDTEEVDD